MTSTYTEGAGLLNPFRIRAPACPGELSLDATAPGASRWAHERGPRAGLGAGLAFAVLPIHAEAVASVEVLMPENVRPTDFHMLYWKHDVEKRYSPDSWRRRL